MASLPDLPFPNGTALPSPAMLSALQAGVRPPQLPGPLPPPPTSVAASLAAGLNPSLMSHYYSLMADKLWGAGESKPAAHSPGSRSPPQPDVRPTTEGKIIAGLRPFHRKNVPMGI